jgi:hypothetical protein
LISPAVFENSFKWPILRLSETLYDDLADLVKLAERISVFTEAVLKSILKYIRNFETK